MPEERKVELVIEISSMLGYENDFIPISEIENFSRISQKDYNEFHNNHGKNVMIKVIDIQKFVELWRTNFIESMKPKFMPEFWDIYRPIYNNDKVLKIK